MKTPTYEPLAILAATIGGLALVYFGIVQPLVEAFQQIVNRLP